MPYRKYRHYLTAEQAATESEPCPAETSEPPEPGSGAVLIHPPHRVGYWRAIWQDGATDRHETAESPVFAEIMRWAFARTDDVSMAELHTSTVGGPSTTRLAPLP